MEIFFSTSEYHKVMEKFDGACWLIALLYYMKKSPANNFARILENQEMLNKMDGSNWSDLLDECIKNNTNYNFFKKILNSKKINEIIKKLDGLPWKIIKYINRNDTCDFKNTLSNGEFTPESINFVFNKLKPSAEVVQDFIKIVFKLKNFSSDDLTNFFQKNTANMNYEEAIIKEISRIKGECFIHRAFEFLQTKNFNSVKKLLKEIQTIKTSILTSDIVETVMKSVENIKFSDQEAITELKETMSPFQWWTNAYIVKYNDDLKEVHTEIDKCIVNIANNLKKEQKEIFLKGVYYARNGFDGYDQKFNPYLHLAMLDTSIACAQGYKLKKMFAKEINEFSLFYNSILKEPRKLFNKYTLCINDEFNKAYPKILEIDTSIDEKGKKSFQITRNASMEKLVDDAYKMQSCSFDTALERHPELCRRFQKLLGESPKILTQFLKEITDESNTLSASDFADPENPYFRILEFYNNAVDAGKDAPLEVPQNSGYSKKDFEKGRCMDGLNIDAHYTIAQVEGLRIRLPTVYMECNNTQKQN
ncbi:hypothetical protein [Holospora obtusa]|nr:hypothetical protein [Holospora obtusa]